MLRARWQSIYSTWIRSWDKGCHQYICAQDKSKYTVGSSGLPRNTIKRLPHDWRGSKEVHKHGQSNVQSESRYRLLSCLWKREVNRTKGSSKQSVLGWWLSCSQIACPNLSGSPRENYNLHISDSSTATRNVSQKHSKERLMPTYFGPKWGSITKIGPEEAQSEIHEALATSTTSLYHQVFGTCQQIVMKCCPFCIKNLGRSKRVLHQLWKPEAPRDMALPPSWCHMPNHGTSRRAALSQRRSPFRNLSGLKISNASVHAICQMWNLDSFSCHVTKRLHCQTMCCSPQTSWHNSWDKLPTMFLHMLKWLLHCPFCKHEKSLPLPFSQTLGAQVWLWHYFEPENCKAMLHQKA